MSPVWMDLLETHRPLLVVVVVVEEQQLAQASSYENHYSIGVATRTDDSEIETEVAEAVVVAVTLIVAITTPLDRPVRKIYVPRRYRWGGYWEMHIHFHMLDLDFVNLNFAVDVVASLVALVGRNPESKPAHDAQNMPERVVVDAAADTVDFHLVSPKEAAAEEEVSLEVLAYYASTG